jgi:hypothetical protein
LGLLGLHRMTLPTHGLHRSKPVHRREFDEHDKPRLPLHQGGDVGVTGASTKSPSQWPGIARSSTSAGLSRMETASMIAPVRRYPETSALKMYR